VSKSNRKFSTYYDHHQHQGLTTTKPSKTQQHFKDDYDINNLLEKYQHQELVPTNTRQPIFGDFSDERITDYHQAMQTMLGVQELMAELPAKVRDRFKNNPAAILAFVADPNNTAEARDLGMLAPEPEPVRIVPPQETTK
jgi:phage internal scaffolding protein